MSEPAGRRLCFFSCKEGQCLRQEPCKDKGAPRVAGEFVGLNAATRRALEENKSHG